MSRAPVEFHLENEDGEAVPYRIIPHQGTELITLAWRVLQAGAKPAGRILDSNLALVIDEFMSDEEFRLDDIKDKIKPELADALDDVFAVVFAAGEVELTRKMLAHTYRDGKPLAKDFEFDRAYQANPAEMIQAFVKALQVNNFLALFPTLLGNFVSVGLTAKTREGDDDNSTTTQSVDLLAEQN